MRGQSKRQSLLEQSLNIGSGFLLSIFVFAFIIQPIFSIDVSPLSNLGIAGIYSAISIIRGYLWRRLFNLINSYQS